MILAFLSTRAGKFAAAGLAIILAIALFMLWLNGREKAAVERDRAEAAAEAAKTARRAEEASSAEIRAVQTEVEKANDEARDAAQRSDDPLGAGFDSLRTKQAGRRPAAR